MARGSQQIFNSKKVPLGTTDYRQVWRAELGMPANTTGLISKCCRHDRGFLSLFYRKKEKQKKLAAADKYAKIMILSLNKKNSLRSDSFLFLTLQSHNFLTLFLRGGRSYCQEQRFDLIPKSVDCYPLSVDFSTSLLRT